MKKTFADNEGLKSVVMQILNPQILSGSDMMNGYFPLEPRLGEILEVKMGEGYYARLYETNPEDIDDKHVEAFRHIRFAEFGCYVRNYDSKKGQYVRIDSGEDFFVDKRGEKFVSNALDIAKPKLVLGDRIIFGTAGILMQDKKPNLIELEIYKGNLYAQNSKSEKLGCYRIATSQESIYAR